MILIYISLLTNGTEQISTFLFKGIAMQILYLLLNWVICLFIVELGEFFFLAIFETLVKNFLPGKSFFLQHASIELLHEFHCARMTLVC